MVASPITIEHVYLDARVENILSGAVSSLEDDTEVHIAESRTTTPYAKSSRVRRAWQLSWSAASTVISKRFHIFRNERGFLFISPDEHERVATGMPLQNTVTGTNTGDGDTVIFQLRFQLSMDKDIGSGEVSSEAYDINYPLGADEGGSVIVYANDVPVTVSGYSQTTGRVTLSEAPPVGALMKADFQYAHPVMFVSKSISRTLLQVDRSEVRSAQIEEIF